jgi:hypothetical protein
VRPTRRTQRCRVAAVAAEAEVMTDDDVLYAKAVHEHSLDE